MGPSDSTVSDHALLCGIQNRDERALADLYDRYGRLLFTLALRIVGDRAMAEEVLQDTFLRCWEAAAQYDVAAALRELPDAQRQAIELAYYGGLTQSEISRVQAEPIGTVKTRMRAALDRLRRVLGRAIDGTGGAGGA